MTAGGRTQAAVLASRTAFRHLMDWAQDRPFALEINPPSSVAPAGARQTSPAIGRTE